MTRTPIASFVAFAVSAAALTGQSHAEIAEKIIREGTTNSRVMQFQDELCHDYGSRLTGSLAFDRAADWAVREFQAMGLDARLVPWGEWKVRWDREQWMGRMVEPSQLELQVACPAWTGGTRGIARGTLVRMPSDDASFDALAQTLNGDGAFWLYGALPRGDYAIAVIHDENNNAKLDTFAGIPKEGFGFSRNPPIRFGPPRFTAARFTLDSDAEMQQVTMRYIL